MTLSTHVLDATSGRPAAGVLVRLERWSAVAWTPVGHGQTGPDGRLADWLPSGEPTSGMYRLTFASGDYFASRGTASFYPEIAVTFEVSSPDEHYHVPLLLSPFAYSTYRGS